MATIRPRIAIVLAAGAVVFPLAIYQKLTIGEGSFGWPALALGTTAWFTLILGVIVASRYEPTERQAELAEYDDA